MLDAIGPGFGDTFVLMLAVAPVGWVYGHVAHIGYSKNIDGDASARRMVAWGGLAMAAGAVLLLRHVINGEIFDGMMRWFQQTLDNMDPLLGVFVVLPFGLLFIAFFLATVAFAIGSGIAVVVGGLFYLPGFLIGIPRAWNWYFVAHPAERIVTPALREGRELNTLALRDALAPTPDDLRLGEPQYHYEHQAKKARALKEQLDADASLAEAAVHRERARAAAVEADREYEEARRRAKR